MSKSRSGSLKLFARSTQTGKERKRRRQGTSRGVRNFCTSFCDAAEKEHQTILTSSPNMGRERLSTTPSFPFLHFRKLELTFALSRLHLGATDTERGISYSTLFSGVILKSGAVKAPLGLPLSLSLSSTLSVCLEIRRNSKSPKLQ